MPKLKYIGTKQISGVENAGIDGCPGIERVTFADGTWEEMHELVRMAQETEKPTTDATMLRDKRAKLLAAAVLEVLKAYNAILPEVDYILGAVLQSIQESDKKAQGYTWRREGEASRDLDKRTFIDLDRALKAYDAARAPKSDG